MPEPRTVVVAGAGLAGLRACEGLRSGGFEGRIVLLGDEARLPYDRPPLSKRFLAGSWSADRLALTSGDKMADLGLEVLVGPGCRARFLDMERRRVGLSCGEEVAFDGLVVATGAVARKLAGVSELEHAHVLRCFEDAVGLRAALRLDGAAEPSGVRLLVVGAGFIGLEVAATVRPFGVEVDIVDPLSVPLGRVLPSELGRVLEEMHRDEGVRFHLSATLSVVEETRDEPLRCQLSDGSVVCVDAVLVCIGAVPAISWLEDSGLCVTPDGLECDPWLRAAPRVVAAGDVARFPFGAGALRHGAPGLRLEHRTSAAELGEHAARSLLAELCQPDAPGSVVAPTGPLGPGGPGVFETVPYVWSDQYDLRLQILGLPGPEDEVKVVEGTLSSRRFLACHGRGGRLAAVVGFGLPKMVMRLRPLLERATSFEEAVALASS